jgi:signal transduction histidine kinase
LSAEQNTPNGGGPAQITLYVAGAQRSAELVAQVKGEARELGGRVQLSIVDVLEDPGRAEEDLVLTTPMIVRWAPSPVRRITGDVVDISLLLPSIEETGAPRRVSKIDRFTPPEDSAVISRTAHELRTPLVVIRGFAQTLVDSLTKLDQETAYRCAEAIVRSTTQLQRVLDTMLVLSSVERGGIRLNLSKVSLGELVQETVRDMRPMVAKHKVSVDVLENVIVEADNGKVRQVVSNLLTNAFKFSPANTTVRVSVRATEESGCVTVDDEGSGIPEDQREKIFQQYERLGHSEKGMGLGLYISRGLAEAHGGSLTASASDSGGARFELVIPRSAS